MLRDFGVGVVPAVAFHAGIKRSTQADVERIFGRTTSLATEDDSADKIYVADDVEGFDERKKLAKELDEMLGDVIVID